MKNSLKYFVCLLVFFIALFICNTVSAFETDLIEQYYITVDPRSDGTLDMTYKFKWKVLDSNLMGPVSWVKIGVPNSKVDQVKKISNNIKKIKYYKENNEDFIRVDFDREYKKDEVIEFEYKFHQSYMYTLSNSTISYSFTPGWFNGIKVNDLRIYWKDDASITSSYSTKSNGYLMYRKSLAPGEKYTISVQYPREKFAVNESKQFKNSQSMLSFNVIIFFVMVCIVISVILSISNRSGYGSSRGYGYGYGCGYGYGHGHYHHHHHHHSSCASSCACVSSCACACACAGGGRAGCSKKDFYGTRLSTKKLNKVLNK